MTIFLNDDDAFARGLTPGSPAGPRTASQDAGHQDGGQAFPHQSEWTPTGRHVVTDGGMSLRDYFAAQALPALIAMTPVVLMLDHAHLETMAGAAYDLADCMLRNRARP